MHPTLHFVLYNCTVTIVVCNLFTLQASRRCAEQWINLKTITPFFRQMQPQPRANCTTVDPTANCSTVDLNVDTLLAPFLSNLTNNHDTCNTLHCYNKINYHTLCSLLYATSHKHSQSPTPILVFSTSIEKWPWMQKEGHRALALSISIPTLYNECCQDEHRIEDPISKTTGVENRYLARSQNNCPIKGTT